VWFAGVCWATVNAALNKSTTASKKLKIIIVFNNEIHKHHLQWQEVCLVPWPLGVQRTPHWDAGEWGKQEVTFVPS
jgi:hypothetical protein